MSRLFNSTGEYTPDNLIAGIDVPVLTKAITLKAGQGLLKRGTVLGVITADGLAVSVDSTKADGSETANCILATDIDTGDAGTTENITAEAYRSGHFNRQALLFGGTDTTEQHENRLRELGIFLSDNVSH